MKTSQKIILGITGILALVGGILSTLTPSKMVGATPALAPYQGGTGTSSVNAGDVGKFLKVSDDSPLTYVFDSASGGSQTPWTSNINAATYSLSGVGSLDATSSIITQATSTDLYSLRGVIPTFSFTDATGTNLTFGKASALGSAGNIFESANGTDVAILGAGNTANSLFYGGVNIDGATRLATSLNGLAFLTNGAVTDIATSSLNLTTSSFLSANISQWTNDSGYLTTVDISANTNLTAGDALTLTNDEIDFDGGATPSGDLGGTWASPSVTDDSHAHTGTTLSGIDISDDTNLSADGTEIVLTGDALSLGTSLTFTQATTTNFAVSSITSAIMQTNGNGTVEEYAGTSCTNQFVRSISALGVATCATVSSSDVSLANLTATDSTLTFSGTYNGATARTIGLNLGNSNAWTALQTFNTAGLIATASSTIQRLSSTNATSTNATSTNLYVSTDFIAPIERMLLLSTSTMGTGTTTKKLSGYSHAVTVLSMGCNSVGGGTFKAVLGDGSASSSVITSSTALSTTFTTLSSNNAFNSGEPLFIAYGTVSGTVADPVCTFNIR